MPAPTSACSPPAIPPQGLPYGYLWSEVDGLVAPFGVVAEYTRIVLPVSLLVSFKAPTTPPYHYYGRIGKIPAYHGLDPGLNPPWLSWFTGMQVKQTLSHDLKATELAMTIKVSIQWLYLAANGCKIYLNL